MVIRATVQGSGYKADYEVNREDYKKGGKNLGR
jgi:hypothetical protein